MQDRLKAGVFEDSGDSSIGAGTGDDAAEDGVDIDDDSDSDCGEDGLGVHVSDEFDENLGRGDCT